MEHLPHVRHCPPGGSAPLWMPLVVVGLTAAALWGILTVLGAGTLQTIPDDTRSAVLALVRVGNVMTALAAVAFWPLISLAFWCAGVLLVDGHPPEFRDLVYGIGLAHLPAMAGMMIIWVIVMAAGVSVPGAVMLSGGTREYLESLAAVQISRGIIVLAFLATAVNFVRAVRALFRTSVLRAAAVVTAPLALYYLGAFLLQASG
ncbi:MAG: hypothetical protein ABIG68_01875 [Acidobacteriota bacterium]